MKRFILTEKKFNQLFDKHSKDNAMLNEISYLDKFEKEKGRTKWNEREFYTICHADPTFNKETGKVGIYTNWLLNRLESTMQLRDVIPALEKFAAFANKDMLGRYGFEKDINKYSIDSLIETVAAFDTLKDVHLSNSEYNNRKKLKDQFRIIGKTDKYELINPLTFEAERYFGSGTEWCTVANEYYFDSYSHDGKLYIVYPLDGNRTEKFQFHFESGSYCDSEDINYRNLLNGLINTYDEGYKGIYEMIKNAGIIPQNEIQNYDGYDDDDFNDDFNGERCYDYDALKELIEGGANLQRIMQVANCRRLIDTVNINRGAYRGNDNIYVINFGNSSTLINADENGNVNILLHGTFDDIYDIEVCGMYMEIRYIHENDSESLFVFNLKTHNVELDGENVFETRYYVLCQDFDDEMLTIYKIESDSDDCIVETDYDSFEDGEYYYGGYTILSNGEYGEKNVIDEYGNLVFEHSVYDVMNAGEDRVIFMINTRNGEKYGIYDMEKEKLVGDRYYDYAEPYNGGNTYVVEINGKEYLIDENGECYDFDERIRLKEPKYFDRIIKEEIESILK